MLGSSTKPAGITRGQRPSLGVFCVGGPPPPSPLLGRKGKYEQFPFRIRGFHSDNGSEYINRTVAQLLNKLLIEQTKSRPRHSNDNGLVETKNGAVIRKHMGYGHIAAAHAEAISHFYREHLNPYLNLHRPCAQADVEIDAKGRKRRYYRRYQTPLETLLAIEDASRFCDRIRVPITCASKPRDTVIPTQRVTRK